MMTQAQDSYPKDFTMSFNDFKIIQMSFVLNEKFKQDKAAEHEIETEVGYSYDPSKTDLTVFLKISISGQNSPYLIEVKTLGLFIFQNLVDSKLVEILSMVNCPAILFPYVRETIADITRRAGFPPLHLQPFNFARMYSESKAKKEESEKKAAG